jgi:hypothetical protein
MRTWLAALAACTGLCCTAGAQAQLAPPANDLCSGATVLSLNTPVYGSTITASSVNDGPNGICQTSTFNRAVWFTFTPATTQLYQVSSCHSGFDTVLQMFSAVDCSTFADASFVRVPGGCNDDQCGGGPGPGATGSGAGSVVNSIQLTGGQQYWIRLSGFSTGSGYYQMAVYDYSTSGACCSNAGVCTIAVPAQCATVDGTFLFLGAGTTCSPNPCVGACCDNTNNTCTVTPPGASSSGCFHGFWQGFTTTCSPSRCVVGTCCTTAGACTITQRFQCAAVSAWNPAQTSCTPTNCNNAAIGACCNTTTGACAVFSSGCPSGTTFQGFGSACSGTCPSGACCTASGACTVTFDPFACSGTSHWYAGGSCTVNPCSIACCDTTTGACSISTGAACGTGTTSLGLGVTCTPDPCPLAACCSTTGTCTLVVGYTCFATSTYMGAGSTCTVNPCTAALGACCSSSGTCSLTMALGCLSTSTFQGAGTTCTVNPCTAQLGACCSSSGSCSLTMYNGCEGTATSKWQGLTTTCTVNPCTAQLGACCSSSGSCTLTMNTGCTGTSTFQTVGSTCTVNPCTAQLGACCSSTGTCTLTMQFGCTGTSTFQSVGTTCTVNPCTAQLGACCSSTGTCSATMPAGCVSGISFTPASACTPNPCGGACCNVATCTVVPAGTCAFAYQGNGSVCSPNPCLALVGPCCVNNICSITLPTGCTGTFGTLGGTCTPYPCFGSLASTCEAFDTTPTGSLPAGWVSAVPTGVGLQWTTTTTNNSAPNGVFTNDAATASLQTLTMPAVTAGGNLFLQFFSNYSTESCCDGWIVEASINGGAFANIGTAAWITNGYGSTITATTNPLVINNGGAGVSCFAGASTTWTERVATINTVLGDSVVFRFSVGSDSSVGATGLNLDNICVYNTAIVNGACCANDGTCTVTTNNNCSAPSFFQGVGSSCNAGLCPTPVTACCDTTTGACVFVSGTTCASGSVANGISCNPNPCPQTGACCSNAGGCTQTSAAACTNGLFQGLGAACGAGNTCPVATSACCNGFGGCVFLAASTCPSGTTPTAVCSPNTCPAAAQACENFDSTATGTIPAGWSNSGGVGAGAAWTVVTPAANSAPNSVFTDDVASISSQFLTLPSFAAGGNVTLDFWSSFTTESTFDGFVVEASINGSTFANIGAAAFTLNTYNATISGNFGSAIANQMAFSGAFPTWTQHTATITANSGDVVVLRFHMACDSSVSSTGVNLDDICVNGIFVPATGVCCRGATCTTTITTAAACTASLIPGQVAGASFPTGSSCNSGPISNAPCCYADYNKTGGITVNDIFDFLADWFAGSPYANVGGNGAPAPLVVQNIFDFLNDWFAGGC